MDMMKVFIENWSKAKPLFLEWAPIIVAVIAVIFSGCSMYLSRKDLIASHRPYVWAVNLIQLDPRDNFRPMLYNVSENEVYSIRCLNAPAKITSIVTAYYGIGKDGKEVLLKKDIDSSQIIAFPGSDDMRHYVNYKLEEAKGYEKIRRRVRIDCKELSSRRKYYFKGDWIYDSKANVWGRMENQEAN